eukprot:7391670-Prymnesium_polylepis.2
MPAVAKLIPTQGASTSCVAATRPVGDSESCSARRPLWQATSAAEHAVSKATHGPIRPRVYESRPQAIEGV